MLQTTSVEQASGIGTRPLCVDLDGTLVKSDTLLDSLLLLVRIRPLQALQSPAWALRGKAALKREVASRVTLDVTHLPYNRPLIAYLKEQKAAGRKIYLATGADSETAERVAAHFDFFDGVLASDGKTNLTGGNKLEGMRNRFGEEGYDYIGNSFVDIPLLRHAGSAMIANPDRGLASRLRRSGIVIEREFDDRAGALKTFLSAIRIHQWAKNVLVLVPFLLSHSLTAPHIAAAVIAFFCFSLCASATYIVNDMLDIDADRRHPRKRARAFASGDMSAFTGAFVAIAFVAAALLAARFLLPSAFLLWLLLYIASTLAYSFYLKRIVLVDVILLSCLYTVRVLAGGAATDVPISPWLSAFSVFLFLSLAMVKRFSELRNALERGTKFAHGRGYLSVDIEQLRSFGTASAYAAVVVFAMYISGRDVTILYHHPGRLWLATPLMLLWLSRVWLLASRGELNEDPIIFAVTDRMSLLIGAAVVLIAVLAAL
ncbi:UbiA family prenyltransferase [Terracidiphilus gabretensis]|uniref:UbiA family prenyltransferase n=1 Tax=Terracidiphilus gabretensis TaxID=1577687 RepID=UPI0012FA6B06|nr:UbiA family prenyltransferase [Terracidiphilus gabretensis]